MAVRNSWLLAAFVSLVVLKILHTIVKTDRLRKVMPPGPPGVPLLGNIFQLGDSQWLKFTEWKETYGPIFSLNFGPQPVIVLSDFKTAADLLDRRSQLYSSRPRFIMASEILTGGMFFPFLPYNDAWRRLRKTIHEGYSARASVAYQPLQEKESAQLALNLLEKPGDWQDHVQRSATATILCSTYGWLPVGTSADAIVQGVNNFMHRLGHACLPGSHLVESFPFMLRLPSWVATWKRNGLYWFKQDTAMFQALFDDVEEKVKRGTHEPSFAATVIQDMKSNLAPVEGAWLAGTMLGVGSEAIAAALLVFFLAMVLHPEAMQKAQEQLDAIVGRERLPTFSDREKLPYIDAMVREVMRWRTVGPIGLPRETMQDDWYDGHFIPKGTLILLNVWGMHREAKYFPDPDEFRPERYLNENGALYDLIPDTHGQGHLTYGSGRRICSGKDVSNQTLFMDYATILWAFNIGKAKDAEGQEITPSDMAFVDQGIVVHPEPFKCEITPRSSEIPSIIRAAV